MDSNTTNKVHNAIGGGAGVVGGLALWITTHLGTAFYALLLLIFVNVVAALWEKDLLKSVHKWLRVIMGVAVPFTIPVLTRAQGIVWSDGDSKFLVGAVFAALLSSTIPDILGFFNRLMTAWNVPKSTQATVDTGAAAEIARLGALVEGLMNQQKPQPTVPLSPTVTYTLKSAAEKQLSEPPLVYNGDSGSTDASQPPVHGV